MPVKELTVVRLADHFTWSAATAMLADILLTRPLTFS
jgi:hypothetical protein